MSFGTVEWISEGCKCTSGEDLSKAPDVSIWRRHRHLEILGVCGFLAFRDNLGSVILNMGFFFDVYGR